MVRLHKGKFLKNFYWLAGPSQGDRGRRVTVLHNNQPSQCSNCLKYSPPPNHSLGPSQYCKGGGNGKICKDLKTERTSLNDYFKSLKVEDGYFTLKEKHYHQYNNFPALGRKETNKTHDTENHEDQATDDDDDKDEEPDKTDDIIDPNKQSHTEQNTQPATEESAEPNSEEEISLVETSKDTNHNNPDHTPPVPTTQTPEEEDKDTPNTEDTPTNNKTDQKTSPPHKADTRR